MLSVAAGCPSRSEGESLTTILMKRITYNKLVRDRIPKIIERDHAKTETKILNSDEFKKALKKKLLEEVDELRMAKTKNEVANEIADVMEILRALSETEHLSWQTIEKTRTTKRKQRGGFSKKIFLKHVTKK